VTKRKKNEDNMSDSKVTKIDNLASTRCLFRGSTRCYVSCKKIKTNKQTRSGVCFFSFERSYVYSNTNSYCISK